MYQRDSLMKIVLLSLLLYALLSLVAMRREIASAERSIAALSEEAARLEAENRQMEQRLACGYSDEEMLRIARERLGLVLPGEKVFYFYSDREE